MYHQYIQYTICSSTHVNSLVSLTLRTHVIMIKIMHVTINNSNDKQRKKFELKFLFINRNRFLNFEQTPSPFSIFHTCIKCSFLNSKGNILSFTLYQQTISMFLLILFAFLLKYSVDNCPYIFHVRSRKLHLENNMYFEAFRRTNCQYSV